MKKSIFLVISILMLSLSTYASGVGLKGENLRFSINFQPNYEATFYYAVTSLNDKPSTIQLYVEDDSQDGTRSNISQYFSLSEKSVRLLPGQESFFSITMKLPDNIDEPGTHTIHIGAVQSEGEGTSAISLRAGVEALININAPFKGQFLKYTLDAYDVNKGDPLPAKLSIVNLGTDTIQNIYSTMTLTGAESITKEATTEMTSLKSYESKVLTATFSTAGLSSGTYNVSATIYHDGKTNYTSRKVKIGELYLEIINQTNEIESGKINEIDTQIKSRWADPVRDVFAEIFIENNSAVRTPSEDIKGFGNTTLKSFFDATKVKPGNYKMMTTLNYEGRKMTKMSVLRIRGSLEEKPLLNSESFMNIILLTAVIIAVVINIILFGILIKRKNEHEKE